MWWKSAELELGQTEHIEFGDAGKLFMIREAHQWVLRRAYNDETPEELHRFACASGVCTIGIALADRPMVYRAENPVTVPAGEEATFFLSSPLWYTVSFKGSSVFDAPIRRPSDSWFGPLNQDGELCYASRTRLRLTRDPAHESSIRAITRVLVKNRISDNQPLKISRLKLPTPHLGGFLDEYNHVWTQDVELVAQNQEQVSATVATGEPKQAGKCTRAFEPRLREASLMRGFIASGVARFGG